MEAAGSSRVAAPDEAAGSDRQSLDGQRQPRRRWRRFLAPGVAVVLLAFMALAVSRLAQDVTYSAVVEALSEVSWWRLGAAGALTALSFLALSFYDVSGLEYAGRRLPYPRVALASFCAYAVGNTAGFGPLSGGAVRYRFYTPLGLKPEEIARVVAFITAGFGLGLVATAGLGLIFAGGPVAEALRMPVPLLRAAGGVVLLLAFSPVIASLRQARTLRLRSVHIVLPRAGLILRQLAITLLDITASAAVLWVLLPQDSIGFVGFVPVYAIAVALGVLSHVPAGLGVFETVMIAALSATLPVDRVLAALVLYRLIYYALPLAAATLTIIALEARRAVAGTALAGAAQLIPPVLAALSLLSGGMLVLSGLTPAAPQRLGLLNAFVPLPIIEGAHFLSSILGTLLLITARGLLFRLDGAWWVTVVATLLALAFAPLKALAVGETVILSLLLIALLATRAEFSRPSSLMHETFSLRWLVAVATILVSCFAVMMFAYKEVAYTHELWWQFEVTADAPRSLRALVGIAFAIATIAVWSLVRPWPGIREKATAEQLEHAVAIAAQQERPDANLVRMGDKSLMFSEDGAAFIMFARQGRSWVALFDPVGARASWPGLVWKFVETARQHGGRAVFYEVGPRDLSLYADAGLAAFKLGESAKVKLADFELQGGRRSNFRNALRKGERAGFEFEVYPADRVPEILNELKAVSDVWLAYHNVREKAFSLGAFDEAYVAAQPVACLRHQGRIIAFATLLTTQVRYEASIDLMRVAPDAPNGTMDFLFLKLILLFKEEGYEWFDLGMAPLSGFRSGSAATLWNRVGRAVFEHGERFYHFKGLHGFKDKFDPHWEPRYMAVSGGINPLIALTDVTVLIGGGLRGVVSK
ncbi:bifunctional lysylphosphatidylglycerol flippase/synthetase MprF [Rhodopseudomonas julia]